MSFQVIAYSPKVGFIVNDYASPRAGARRATQLAKQTGGDATLLEKEPGHRAVPLMTCTMRRPDEGRKYARCVLTAAGETYLRGKR